MDKDKGQLTLKLKQSKDPKEQVMKIKLEKTGVSVGATTTTMCHIADDFEFA